MPPRREPPTPVERLEQEVRGTNYRQRMRSNPPAPPAGQQPPQQSRGPNSALAAQIAAAKAKVAAAAAAASAAGGAPRSGTASAPPVPTAPPRSVPSPAPLPAPAAGGSGPSALQARLAAARAKVSALSGNQNIPTPPSSSASASPAPHPSATPTHVPSLSTQRPTPSTKRPTPTNGKDDWRNARKPKAPKFSSVGANAAVAQPSSSTSTSEEDKVSGNPYLATTAEAGPSAPKGRSTHAPLKFSRPGRYIAAAETLRREAAMEDLKARIAERTRKAGLTEAGEERVAMLRKPVPPPVEWWDEPFATTVEGSTTPSYTEPSPTQLDKLDAYVQHPIEVPPVEKGKPPPRGVMLTTKEAKKLRRQRRAAELSDKRDRIKMGLMPPPPDKVKLSNLMRVLGNSATADPTRVEARVRRDIVARYEQHLAANEARQLTPEQRTAKREMKKELEVEARGLREHLYSIAPAISNKHRYKISTNARQLGLTGRVVYAPGQSAVLVQGGPQALRKFNALMMRRIDWTDPDQGQPQEGTTDRKPLPEGESKEQDFVQNQCVCVFEGAAISRTWERFNVFHVDSIAAPAREAFAPRPELWDRVRAVIRLQGKEDDV